MRVYILLHLFFMYCRFNTLALMSRSTVTITFMVMAAVMVIAIPVQLCDYAGTVVVTITRK